MASFTEPTSQTNYVGVLPIEERHLDSLGDLLPTFAANGQVENSLHFEAVPGLHFARLALVDSGVRGGRRPALLFTTRFDVPANIASREAALRHHFRALTAAAGPALLQAFQYCEYAPKDAAEIPEFLSEYTAGDDAHFSGTGGRSVEQIVAESQLKQRLRQRLVGGQLRELWGHKDPQLVRRDIVNTVPGFGVYRAEDTDTSEFSLWTSFLGILFVVWLPITVPLSLLYVAWLRWSETRDPAVVATSAVEARSRVLGPDALTLLVPLKPGKLRLLTLKVVLWFVALATRNMQAAVGPLTPLAGFHYAQWSLIDGGRQLLFVADVDADAGLAQLDGFFLQVVNAIWSNTQGFPETSFLFWRGAFDRESFKAWLRQYRVESGVHYCAYPELTARSINQNTDVRQGLADSRHHVRVQDWLQQIEA